MLQAGIELVGVPGPEGTAEALDRAVRGARRGRPRRTTASGSATRRCTRRCSTRTACRRPRARRSCTSCRRATSSGSSARSRALRLGAEATRALLRVPQLRGGPEVLDAAGPAARRAARACMRALPEPVAEPRDLRPRAGRGRSATTPAPCSRSTTRRSGAPLGGGGPLRRPATARFGARPARPRAARRPRAAAPALVGERRRRARVIFDLGLAARSRYYTGAVFEVYDAALACRSAAAGATTTCSAASAATCRRRAGR